MKNTRTRSLACLALFTSLLWLGGCYQRVVSVKSGNYKGTVYEANVETENPNAQSSRSKSSR